MRDLIMGPLGQETVGGTPLSVPTPIKTAASELSHVLSLQQVSVRVGGKTATIQKILLFSL